jgi:hypothetical protein
VLGYRRKPDKKQQHTNQTNLNGEIVVVGHLVDPRFAFLSSATLDFCPNRFAGL